MKILLLIISIFAVGLSAISKHSPYMQDNKNSKIIDIGEIDINTQGSAQMIWSQYQADYEILDDFISTRERVLSEKTACIIDKLGNVTCPLEAIKCNYNEEIISGGSTKTTAIMLLSKTCGAKEVLLDDKCYIDVNNNGIPDIFTYKYVSIDIPSKSICADHNAIGKINVSKNSVSLSIAGGYYWQIDKNCPSAGYINFFSTSYSAGYEYIGASIDIYTWGWGCNSLNYYGLGSLPSRFGLCPRGWSQNLNINLDGHLKFMKKCPSGYTKEDGQGERRCYKTAQCPTDSTLNANYQCQRFYTYYKYTCPIETNYYGNTFISKDPGFDCKGYCPDGSYQNCVCNDALPPENNCVRTDYFCPYDSTKKCTVAEKDGHVCDDGFEFVNNRCERIEKYCGDNIYDITKDICVTKEEYEKICTEAGDFYDITKNICTSAQEVCATGLFSAISNTCKVDGVISCLDTEYTYNAATKMCENPNAKICAIEGYTYDETQRRCSNGQTICEVNYTYDIATKSCVKNLCSSSANSIDRTRCEKDINYLCAGTITIDGNCILDVSE